MLPLTHQEVARLDAKRGLERATARRTHQNREHAGWQDQLARMLKDVTKAKARFGADYADTRSER